MLSTCLLFSTVLSVSCRFGATLLWSAIAGVASGEVDVGMGPDANGPNMFSPQAKGRGWSSLDLRGFCHDFHALPFLYTNCIIFLVLLRSVPSRHFLSSHIILLLLIISLVAAIFPTRLADRRIKDGSRIVGNEKDSRLASGTGRGDFAVSVTQREGDLRSYVEPH